MILQVSIIIIQSLVYITACLMYRQWYDWKLTFQGKALMLTLISIAVIFTANSIAALLVTLNGELEPWWHIVSTTLFLIVTLTGIGLCRALYKGRNL